MPYHRVEVYRPGLPSSMLLLSWPLVVRSPPVVHSAVICAPEPMSVLPSAQPSRLQKFRVALDRYAGVSSPICAPPLVTRLSPTIVRVAGVVGVVGVVG